MFARLTENLRRAVPRVGIAYVRIPGSASTTRGRSHDGSRCRTCGSRRYNSGSTDHFASPRGLVGRA